MAAMLEFDHVHFGYGRAVILPDLSFTIEKGDMVALIGANGAGKSTVSRLCNGLLLPSKGHVRVSGMDTKKVRTSALAKKIGFLFQNPDRQICKNTVYEELAFGLQVQGVRNKKSKWKKPWKRSISTPSGNRLPDPAANGSALRWRRC